jgi:hypothetical protein
MHQENCPLLTDAKHCYGVLEPPFMLLATQDQEKIKSICFWEARESEAAA